MGVVFTISAVTFGEWNPSVSIQQKQQKGHTYLNGKTVHRAPAWEQYIEVQARHSKQAAMQCCHMLARPSLALRCLDACGAEEWGSLAYLLERARLHVQICNMARASEVLGTALGLLQQQPFCKEHGEALVSACCHSLLKKRSRSLITWSLQGPAGPRCRAVVVGARNQL